MSLILSGSDGVSDIDGSASTPAIRGTDTNTGIFFPAADTIAFSEGGAEAMRINSSGYVGIGTTSPGSPLSVLSSVATAQGIYRNTDVSVAGAAGVTLELGALVGTTPTPAAQIVTVLDDANAGNIRFGTRSSGTVTERARITSGGGFLLGTTTAGAGWGAGGTVLTVDEASTFGVIKNAGGSSSPVLLIWNATGTTDNGFLTFATETGGSTRGSIDYNRTGGLTRYNTTSDATLKNIIGDADNQKSVEILNSTRIREFAWKDDATQKPQIGVIAQELYETYKGAVSVGGDVEQTDEEGNVTTKYNPWGVDKTAFTFHLVAGWQAHEKKIAEQQAKIDALEARLAALENK